jgi:hypothetical protein
MARISFFPATAKMLHLIAVCGCDEEIRLYNGFIIMSETRSLAGVTVYWNGYEGIRPDGLSKWCCNACTGSQR